MAKKLPVGRRAARRLRLDRRDPGSGIDRRRPAGSRARTRRLARYHDGFRDDLHPGRAALLLSPRAVSGARPGDAHLPQQRKRDGPADAPSGLVPARLRRRRRGHSLERAELALPADRFHGPQPDDAALRSQMIPPDMTIQDWGVTYDELEPYYDKWGVSLRHLRQGRQHQGADPAGRQSVRGAALARFPEPADGDDLCAGAVRPGGQRRSVYSPSRRPSANMSRPTQTRSACSSGRAPIAASARSSPAATTQSRARRRRSCRC